ncbi:hypothetical protein [Nocardia donostiensis]|uniref:Fido domain-containing protein n=1 Tax=Nocardia donostiensis TaxID=1538463 RepID=A0A1W0BEF8_9NOCA|nr:hypothetical protein [Nocardia donostiensis]ONM50615.1 hypothetical protein B0T46_01570 [Nocardia donostiensis]OQS20741.1 hypothetical protein B0T44_08895 [Nocardia donostiensis]
MNVDPPAKGLADAFLQGANRIVSAADDATRHIADQQHEVPREMRKSLEQHGQANQHAASEVDAAAQGLRTGLEHTGDVRQPVSGRDPGAEYGFRDRDIDEQIRELEAALGIRTDAQRALEMSLFMEDKFRDIALISRQVRPETIFDGPVSWAGWLDARVFARRNLHRDMSLDLMREMHRRLTGRQGPDVAGQLRGHMWGRGGMSRPLTPKELAAVAANPLLGYHPGPLHTKPHGVVLRHLGEGPPRPPEATWPTAPLSKEELAAIEADPMLEFRGPDDSVLEHGAILYPSCGTVERAEELHERLADWCNDAMRRPGADPYAVAAEFQRQFISAHSFQGDSHGRHSRILMDFVLEKSGVPPSAPVEFDKDLLAPLAEWTDEVRAGSERYARWQDKLERSGADIDPVELFELETMMQRYQQMGGETSPFVPGELHDVEKYERLHAELRAGQ